MSVFEACIRIKGDERMKRKALNIRDLTASIPVIQGGMGVGISLAGLAGSVAKCGGVGVISSAQIGYNEPGFQSDPIGVNQSALTKQIGLAKEMAGNGILGVNIMVATRKYETYVRTAVKAGIDLIISGAGLPIRLPELVEKSKTKIAPIVSSIKSAAVIFKLWDRTYKRVPDLLVIEGPQAGGHLGFTYEQLKDMDALNYDREIQGIIALADEYGRKYDYKIPVVTAGGIYQREDMEKQLSLGASGVQMGTRFVTTYECDAGDAFKQAYINAQEEDIQIVKSPVGMPGRAIKNAFLLKAEHDVGEIKACYQCLERCKGREIPYCITEALVNAVSGNIAEGLIFCGSNAYKAKELEHVSDIMHEFK